MEYLYETHVHTREVSACASCSAAAQVNVYKEKGYSGIIVTDHFINGNSVCPRGVSWDKKMESFLSGYLNAKEEGERVGLDVFLGWEFYFRDTGVEFLTYGLDIDFLMNNPGFDRLDVPEYSALVRENGGYIAQSHPYRKAWYIEHDFPVDPALLDGVEVFNASMPYYVNTKALLFAKQSKLPMQSGSDSHSAAVDFRSGISLKSKASDIFEIIEAIKSGKAGLITNFLQGDLP